MIEVDASMLPGLGNNEFYYHQIIGLSAVTTDGKTIGRVTDIMETPGNELYVVQGADKEYLIPAVKPIIADINLDTGIMTIAPIDGLLD
jgi:16S rRNA processing protein RimM